MKEKKTNEERGLLERFSALKTDTDQAYENSKLMPLDGEMPQTAPGVPSSAEEDMSSQEEKTQMSIVEPPSSRELETKRPENLVSKPKTTEEGPESPYIPPLEISFPTRPSKYRKRLKGCGEQGAQMLQLIADAASAEGTWEGDDEALDARWKAMTPEERTSAWEKSAAVAQPMMAMMMEEQKKERLLRKKEPQASIGAYTWEMKIAITKAELFKAGDQLPATEKYEAVLAKLCDTSRPDYPTPWYILPAPFDAEHPFTYSDTSGCICPVRFPKEPVAGVWTSPARNVNDWHHFISMLLMDIINSSPEDFEVGDMSAKLLTAFQPKTDLPNDSDKFSEDELDTFLKVNRWRMLMCKEWYVLCSGGVTTHCSDVSKVKYEEGCWCDWERAVGLGDLIIIDEALEKTDDTTGGERTDAWMRSFFGVDLQESIPRTPPVADLSILAPKQTVDGKNNESAKRKGKSKKGKI
jgi:hypothetical protein